MSKSKSFTLGVSLYGLAFLVIIFAVTRGVQNKNRDQKLALESQAAETERSKVSQTNERERSVSSREKDNEVVELSPKPFPIAHQSEHFSWADADGLDPKVIAQLTAYPERAEIHERNNFFTIQRQLVYLPDDFREKTQELYDGDSNEIPIPGVDGQELLLRMRGAPERIDFGDSRPLTAHFTATVHYPDGTPLQGAIAEGAFTDGFWSIGYEYEGLSYVYETRIENELIVNLQDPTRRDQYLEENFGGANDIIVDTDNVGQVGLEKRSSE